MEPPRLSRGTAPSASAASEPLRPVASAPETDACTRGARHDARCSAGLNPDLLQRFHVCRTTGVQLRGPEGAQRLRASSAATSELCDAVSQFAMTLELGAQSESAWVAPKCGFAVAPRQQRLYLFPEPQGQGSLRPVLAAPGGGVLEIERAAALRSFSKDSAAARTSTPRSRSKIALGSGANSRSIFVMVSPGTRSSLPAR